jgi:hypothetical protein
VVQVARLRFLRGSSCDSRWRLLTLSREGEVRLRGVTRPEETPVATPRDEEPRSRSEIGPLRVEYLGRSAASVADFLAGEYLNDTRSRRLAREEAGWRSLVQIARGIGLSPTSLYPRGGLINPTLRALESEGLLETRLVHGSRGRGGVAAKFRIAQDGDRARAPPDSMVSLT